MLDWTMSNWISEHRGLWSLVKAEPAKDQGWAWGVETEESVLLKWMLCTVDPSALSAQVMPNWEEWADTLKLPFRRTWTGWSLHWKDSLGECKVVPAQGNYPITQEGKNLVESSSAEKIPGILVYNKLPMRQWSAPVAKKTSGVLGWIRQRLANRSRGVVLPTPGEVWKLWLFSLEEWESQWESSASL